jgi:Mg2+-importing ATPase
VTDTEELLTAPIEDVFAQLRTSQSGLSSKEAEDRIGTYGRNVLAERRRRTGAVEFLYHLKNPLVIILLVAGAISVFVIGDLVSASIIFFIVLLSVILDVYQESRAENAAEKLKEKVATTATILRDGTKREVRLSEIVPGDIVYLSAGDIVPADSRAINAKDLYINQSALTGESFPVEKNAAPLTKKEEAITEWDNFLFLGTSVVSGTATAVVVKTGSSTEFGKIAKRLVTREPETEFERGLTRFGSLMVEVTLALVLFVFFINTLRFVFYRSSIQYDAFDSLLFAVALAVGLTPELLPMIMSINLSKGALEMSKKGVIVKRLASIQNFGNMDVFCTDKTGTLTENKITLVMHVDIDGKNSDKVLIYSYLNSYHETGLKSPLDDAILKYKSIDITNYEKVDEIPFDFTRRRVTIVVDREGERFLLTKGAPEEILRVCSYCESSEGIFDITNEFHKQIEKEYYDLSTQGFRVLAVSYKKSREKKQQYSVNDETDMVFLGFVAFLDPPKADAKESLQVLNRDHIELKILTGDNELVTKTTCDQLGFEIKGVLLGSELVHMQDDALIRVVEEANIFARVTPAQKDRIMNALKFNGHVVGFLGDGINDAPSLRTADVGVSVENAVDVAKESADIILLQKSLGVLGDGVLEGRKTFGNTMKYINMGTSSNFGNMFSVAGASMFLPFLPMMPTQILLNNLLYDLSEATIPTDNVDPEYIEKPKRLDISYIRRFMVVFGPLSSIFDFLTFFVMLLLFGVPVSLLSKPQVFQFQTAWFIESLCTQTLVVFVIRTRKTPSFRSRPSKFLLFSSLAVVFSALILPSTPIGALFKFKAPPLLFFLILAGLVGAYLLLVELFKKWFVKRYSYRLEQILVPPKGVGKAKVVQSSN